MCTIKTEENIIVIRDIIRYLFIYLFHIYSQKHKKYNNTNGKIL